jgi:tellurite resistance protein TerC
MDYLTGFLVEKSLALDNVFVIALIFSPFAIPRLYQHRVLFWGILGVIVLRAIMIGLGATLVTEFAWMLYLFGAFLLLTGVKMLLLGDKARHRAQPGAALPATALARDRDAARRALLRAPDPDPGASGRQRLYLTPLFLALVLIEIADIIFAVDSVPAIFAITQDPFVVYTSNIFAILGLRALYFALAAMIHRFRYLKYALALVLVFIGAKIFLVEMVGKIPSVISLAVTLGLLAGGVFYSLEWWRTRRGASPGPCAWRRCPHTAAARLPSPWRPRPRPWGRWSRARPWRGRRSRPPPPRARPWRRRCRCPSHAGRAAWPRRGRR